jgi:uncharacterized protein
MALEDQIEQALNAAPSLTGRTVQGAWIFGSRGAGTHVASSDLDLALLCDPPLGLDRVALADTLAARLGVDVDVVDMATADPILAWEVITSGRLLFVREPATLQAFMRRARFRAEDADQRNRMIVLALGPSP